MSYNYKYVLYAGPAIQFLVAALKAIGNANFGAATLFLAACEEYTDKALFEVLETTKVVDDIKEA